jgi:hypothetical protein
LRRHIQYAVHFHRAGERAGLHLAGFDARYLVLVACERHFLFLAFLVFRFLPIRPLIRLFCPHSRPAAGRRRVSWRRIYDAEISLSFIFKMMLKEVKNKLAGALFPGQPFDVDDRLIERVQRV